MTKPRVSYLIFRTRENTGSNVVFDQALGLRKSGCHVAIFTIFGSSASWYPKGITTRSVFSYFFTPRPDVLIATFWPTAYVTILLRAQKKFYLVMGWEEEFYKKSFLRFFVKQTYRLPLKKFVVSSYLKERILKLTGKKEKIEVVRTYVPKNLFPKRRVLSAKSKVKQKILVLSVISFYNRTKGPDLLEKVVRQLRSSDNAGYCFVLVSRENNPYSEVFDEFYSNPSRDILVELYQKADIMLATSRYEGFYIPGIEAMANGCPFLTTNSGGINEYAVDGENALIVRSIKEIWQKDLIKKLLGSPKLHTRIMENGYKTAEEYKRYSLSDLGQDLLKVFKSS